MNEKRTQEGIARRKKQRAAWKKTPAGKASRKASYERNRERILIQNRAKYASDESLRKKILAHQSEKRIRKGPRPKSLKTRAIYAKEYRQRHPEKIRESLKEYQKANPEKIRQWARNRHHRGMKSPEFVIVKRMRGRLHDELRFRSRKTVKFASILDFIGCSRSELVKYIESKFKEGTSWENRTEWHVDHIRPVSSFDMLDENEQRKCFHFSNLQPLWREENLAESDKIIYAFKAA